MISRIVDTLDVHIHLNKKLKFLLPRCPYPLILLLFFFFFLASGGLTNQQKNVNKMPHRSSLIRFESICLASSSVSDPTAFNFWSTILAAMANATPHHELAVINKIYGITDEQRTLNGLHPHEISPPNARDVPAALDGQPSITNCVYVLAPIQSGCANWFALTERKELKRRNVNLIYTFGDWFNTPRRSLVDRTNIEQ